MNEKSLNEKLLLTAIEEYGVSEIKGSVEKFHTVNSGETLYRIHDLYGISVDQIKRWNSLTRNTIYPGQKLKISDSGNLKRHNPTILQYSKDSGFKGILDDETAWCSIFINWVAWANKAQRSQKANARSWLNVGYKVDDPVPGDVVVFWRESIDSWKGHVGLYVRREGSSIYTCGGNQSDQVNISPYDSGRLLEYRRLNYAA